MQCSYRLYVSFHYSGEMVDGVPPDAAELGARIRHLRTVANRSLDDLAAASGVSRSMISEVERGGRVPTVLVLDRIATGLGTSIARLVRADAEPQVHVLRRGTQDVLVDAAGWSRRILSPVLLGVEFEFMRTVLGSRVDAGIFLPHGKGSREYVAVERGRLQLTLDEEVTVLETGDSVYFPGSCHHGFANPGAAECVYYLVMDLGAHDPGARS
jgi:transcriptional regulator with XRE-family HTH domain